MYRKEIGQVINAVLQSAIVKATKFIDEKTIIRGVRKCYGKKIHKRGNIEITLTIGRPNFRERKFIKVCKKAGEPFPVKNILIKTESK